MTLLDKLRAAGLIVHPQPDWQTATNSGRDRVETVGVLNHWDAIRGWPGVSKYLSNNRFGGILYHGVIRATGELHLLSQRYVWHAGSGSSRILAIAQAAGTIPDDAAGPDNTNGNPHFWSWCINYHPDDGPVPEAQYDALVIANRVAVDHFGLVVGQVARHMDWTTRKRDIDTIDLAQFRDDISNQEDDDMRVREFVEGLAVDPTRIDRLIAAGVIGGQASYWRGLLSNPDDPAWKNFVNALEVETAIASKQTGGGGPLNVSLTGTANPA